VKYKIFQISLIYSILFAISIKGYCQSPIIIDLSEGTTIAVNDKSVNKIKPGEKFYVQVKGINKDLYKVVIATEDTTYTSKISFPSFDHLAIDKFEKLLSGLSTLGTSIKAYIGDGKAEYPDDSSCATTIAAFDTETNNHIIEFDEKRKEAYRILDVIYEIHRCSKLLAGCNATQIAKIDNLPSDVSSLRDDILSFKNSVLVTKNSHLPQLINCNDESEKAKTLKEAHLANIDSLVSRIEDLYAGFTPSNLDKLLSPLITIQNNSINTEYTSLPFIMNSERINLKVSIVPEDTAEIESYYTTTTFPKKKKNYTAVGASFFYSMLDNESLSFNQDTSGFTNVIREDTSKFEIGYSIPFYYG